MTSRAQHIPALKLNEPAPFGTVVKPRREGMHRMVYPKPTNLDYLVDDCPIQWLNVANMREAVAYYQRHMPYLTSEMHEFLAKEGLKRKMMAAIKQSQGKKSEDIVNTEPNEHEREPLATPRSGLSQEAPQYAVQSSTEEREDVLQEKEEIKSPRQS